MGSEDRHSEALEAELIADPKEKAHREAKNPSASLTAQ